MASITGTVLMLRFAAQRGELHGEWLAAAGYTVLSGEPETGAPLDAVYLDLTESEADGLRAMRRIRGRGRKISMVALLEATAAERIDAVMRQGAFDYLSPPTDRYRLLTTIRNAVDRTRAAQAQAVLEGGRPEPIDGIVRTLDEIEQDAIERALARTNNDLDAVIRQLGIGRATLYRKLKKYRLR